MFYVDTMLLSSACLHQVIESTKPNVPTCANNCIKCSEPLTCEVCELGFGVITSDSDSTDALGTC